MSTMTAVLNDGDNCTKTEVPSQRAYPPFIAQGERLYQCRNVASASGDYDLVGRVHVVGSEDTTCCSADDGLEEDAELDPASQAELDESRE